MARRSRPFDNRITRLIKADSQEIKFGIPCISFRDGLPVFMGEKTKKKVVSASSVIMMNLHSSSVRVTSLYPSFCHQLYVR